MLSSHVAEEQPVVEEPVSEPAAQGGEEPEETADAPASIDAADPASEAPQAD